MPEDQTQTDGQQQTTGGTQPAAGTQDAATGTQTATPPTTWGAWLDAQPAEMKTLVQTLHDAEIHGLKSALDSERGKNKDAEKQLRELAEKAEKGSELQAKLAEMADSVQEAQRRSDFMEAAHAAGVTNLKLAYTVAVQDEMFDKHGRPNFEAMKTSYPELFASGKPAPPPGNAGAGTGTTPPPAGDMNTWIRKSAGA